MDCREDVLFITAQEDKIRFLWEIEVQTKRFLELGVNPDNIVHIVAFRGDFPSADYRRVASSLPARFIAVQYTPFYYIPQCRPFAISHALRQLPDNKPVVYLDSDVYPIRLPNLESWDQKTVWLSDARSYLNSNYIKEKQREQLFIELCDIAGIAPEVVESKNNTAGGAQYLLPAGVFTSDFMYRCSQVMERMYVHMKTTENKYSPGSPIQAWTADMWAILWAFWKAGIPTEIVDEMRMCLSATHISEWDRSVWYHDSLSQAHNHKDYVPAPGGTAKGPIVFAKTDYLFHRPFGADLTYVDPSVCSWNYVHALMAMNN